MAAQEGCADLAAATAARASSSEAAQALCRSVPVSGEITSTVAEVLICLPLSQRGMGLVSEKEVDEDPLVDMVMVCDVVDNKK